MNEFDWFDGLPRWKRTLFLVSCSIVGNERAFRWFGYYRAKEWETIKAELRKRAHVQPLPGARARAMRIRIASGVRYPREEKSE